VVEDATFDPALEGAMDGTIVGVRGWEVVPLTAGAQPKDDGVEGGPLVDALAATRLGWVVLGQDGIDTHPQLV
jgi:hypothetical protein